MVVVFQTFIYPPQRRYLKREFNAGSVVETRIAALVVGNGTVAERLTHC